MAFSFSDAAFRPIRSSLGEYGRGVAGGLIFSMPLLYTMELWQAGHRIGPARLIGGVLATFVLLLGYNRYAGLREDASFIEVAIDSVEEFGIGLLLSAGMFWLMGLIGNERPTVIQIERLVVEALLAAIGVSVGTAQLDSSEDDSGIQEDDGDDHSLASDMTLSSCGALLLATSIAATDEVPIIAAATTSAKLMLMLAASLLLATVILAYSQQRERGIRQGRLELAVAVALTVSVALLVSAALLWFFDRFEDQSLYSCIAQTVVLAVPSSLGAAAGRLLLQ
jgi:putative integral membrane protein (TIGR02587 family)